MEKYLPYFYPLLLIPGPDTESKNIMLHLKFFILSIMLWLITFTELCN